VPVGTVVQGSAKAWVNFNGDGTVAIRAAFNVTSVTDNGTGDYTVNFTNSMSDANYVIGATGGTSGTDSALCLQSRNDLCTASSARIYMKGTNAAFFDIPALYVSIFR